MIDVLVPEEQEGTKAVVRGWLKAVGEAVSENDPLVELETDKVTQEVPAPVSGVLVEILLDTAIAPFVPRGVLELFIYDQLKEIGRELEMPLPRQKRSGVTP